MTSSLLETSLITTILGIGTVFIILIILSFFVYLLKYVNKPEKNDEVKKVTKEVIKTEPVIKEAVVKETLMEDSEDFDDRPEENPEEIAAVMAAISMMMNKPQEKIVIKSIRKVSRWNE